MFFIPPRPPPPPPATNVRGKKSDLGNTEVIFLVAADYLALAIALLQKSDSELQVYIPIAKRILCAGLAFRLVVGPTIRGSVGRKESGGRDQSKG